MPASPAADDPVIRWLLLAVVWLVLRLLRRLPAPSRPRRPTPETAWNPHAVLGVPHDAAREAITDELMR
jgi:hypothetical protein